MVAITVEIYYFLYVLWSRLPPLLLLLVLTSGFVELASCCWEYCRQLVVWPSAQEYVQSHKTVAGLINFIFHTTTNNSPPNGRSAINSLNAISV